MSAAFSGLWRVIEQDFEIGAYYLEKELLTLMVYAWKTVINLHISLSLRGERVHFLYKKINSKCLSISVVSKGLCLWSSVWIFSIFIFPL